MTILDRPALVALTCPCAEIARAQIEPFAGADQFAMAGPRVALDPLAAQHVSLALHELATNAVKHGALWRTSGRVNLRWSNVSRGKGCFEMVWNENGGPPPAASVKKGYGPTVVERLTPSALGGPAKLSIAPTGVNWTLRMPLTRLVEVGAHD